MVKIRFQRAGRKHDPFYHIVVSDSRTTRDGAAIERLGYYDPQKDLKDAVLNEELVIKWLGNGAIPSETVRAILKAKGITAKVAAKK